MTILRRLKRDRGVRSKKQKISWGTTPAIQACFAALECIGGARLWRCRRIHVLPVEIERKNKEQRRSYLYTSRVFEKNIVTAQDALLRCIRTTPVTFLCKDMKSQTPTLNWELSWNGIRKMRHGHRIGHSIDFGNMEADKLCFIRHWQVRARTRAGYFSLSQKKNITKRPE